MRSRTPRRRRCLVRSSPGRPPGASARLFVSECVPSTKALSRVSGPVLALLLFPSLPAVAGGTLPFSGSVFGEREQHVSAQASSHLRPHAACFRARPSSRFLCYCVESLLFLFSYRIRVCAEGVQSSNLRESVANNLVHLEHSGRLNLH